MIASTGNRIVDELLRMNEQLLEVKAKLDKIDANTQVKAVTP